VLVFYKVKLKKMKISLKIYLGLFTLLMFGMLTIAFKKSTYTIYQPSSGSVIEQSMSGVNAKRFDKEGHLTQVVNMQSWVHYQGQNVNQMTKPTLKMIHQDGGIWNISAEQGEGFQIHAKSKLEKLQLSQDVVVTRSDSLKNTLWELKTQDLTYFPEQSSAMTDSSVIVNGPGVEIHAIGLRANLENHSVELLKEVKTHYESPQT
jgi:LPS export ABC transporter protein LptC